MKFNFFISITICFVHLLSNLSYSQTNPDFYTNNIKQIQDENDIRKIDNNISPLEETDDSITEIQVETNKIPKKTEPEVISEDLPETDKTNQEVIFKDLPETDKKNYDELNYFDYTWKSVVFPGFGQYALGRSIKGFVFYSLFMASGSLGLYFHFKAEDTYQKYLDILDKKRVKEITGLYDDYLIQNRTANAFFYVTLGIWIYSIFDIIVDVRWINRDLAEENRVALDFNSKRVYYNVYKKVF